MRRNRLVPLTRVLYKLNTLMLVLCVLIWNKSKELNLKILIDWYKTKKPSYWNILFSNISFNLSLLYKYVYGIMKFNLSMKWFYKLWGLLFWKYSSALKHKWLLIFETSSPKWIKTMPAYKRIRSKSNYHGRSCTLIDGCCSRLVQPKSDGHLYQHTNANLMIDFWLLDINGSIVPWEA